MAYAFLALAMQILEVPVLLIGLNGSFSFQSLKIVAINVLTFGNFVKITIVGLFNGL